MKRLISQIVPFIFIGIAIVAFAFGVMLLAYLFLFGALLGLVLYLISWVREKLFPQKPLAKRPIKSGRIIDSDDWKKL